MTDFRWLAGLEAGDWTTGLGDRRCCSMTLAEFATRSGCTAGSAIGEFRNWAFAQQSQRYAVVWTNANDPDDLVLIVATE